MPSLTHSFIRSLIHSLTQSLGRATLHRSVRRGGQGARDTNNEAAMSGGQGMPSEWAKDEVGACEWAERGVEGEGEVLPVVAAWCATGCKAAAGQAQT